MYLLIFILFLFSIDMTDEKFKDKRHVQIYDMLLGERIKGYEQRFDVKITNIKELKMSIKRFEVVINMSNNNKAPVIKKFKFGSKSRDTYFDMLVRFHHLGDLYDHPEAHVEYMNQKREAFKSRHSEIKLKDGKRAIDVVSPASLSYYILW